MTAHPIRRARPESLICHGCRTRLRPNQAVMASPPSERPLAGGRRRAYAYHIRCMPT